ncbi:unnamed protein product [Schistosoma curassoni]|uniref:Uncharacterized protein n=1 Tax=Schistosoma curassoni TaxID=6186 RepID=A0A183KIS6_9TREM|nr:unnamed protein product [Schistosoma curassoni]
MKKLAGKCDKLQRPVKDKQDRPFAAIQEQRNRLVENLELSSRSSPLGTPDLEVAHIDLSTDVTPPIIEQISMDIRRHSSRSTEVRYRNDCENAPRSIQEDLRGRTSATDRLERRTPHQDTKERKSEQM